MIQATALTEGTALGKFKSVDALSHAYEELESEFTRRSQRLKQLEDELGKLRVQSQEKGACGEEPEKEIPEGEVSGKEKPDEKTRQDELYSAASESEAVRTRIIGDYLRSLGGVPLMVSGTSVTAPAKRPASFEEAGELALGYFRAQKKS